MLSINTNISSLIAQQSMSSATNKLNQAIERMTTGYKINGAKDNAANYSISQNMQTQLGSYDVAADNVAMGMDLVTTASDIINNMQDKATRLQALCTQARNGTYGAQSMAAINSEAGAIMSEINRLYMTAEYNNVSLFNRESFQIDESLPQAKSEYNGFIEDPKTYTDEEVAAMTRVKDVSTFTSGEKYAIYTKEEFVKLADSVNGGNKMEDVEFVLGADIDLSSISNWTPIGTSTNPFRGMFDGNGHAILNLTINTTSGNQGLFGYADCDGWDWKTISIKNVALKNVDIKGGSNVGALLGYAAPYGENWFKISNCYSTGNVEGTNNIGGLIGIEAHYGCDVAMTYNNLYSECNITGKDSVGGIIGLISSNDNYTRFENLFSTGNIIGENCVGGIVGEIYSWQDALGYSKSYATGNIVGNSYVGGLIGKIKVYASNENVIQDSASYSKTISGNSNVGSIVGSFNGESNPWGNGIYNETLVIENCQTVLNKQALGAYYIWDDTSNSLVVDTDYDLSVFDVGVSAVKLKGVLTSLQVGIKSDSSNQITFDTNFKFDLSAIEGNIASDEAFAAINDFTNLLSEKSTQLGAVQNRLDSALESITVNMENLTSSLSTIRDADIAEVSSLYIQQQILQQASATLLATANQSPSIALQLI